MSFVTQPPIQGVLVEFASAGVLMVLGMVLENGKYDRASVFATVIGFFVLPFTTEFDWLVMPIPLFYCLFGFIVAIIPWNGLRKVYGLFGSKVYGSLMFSIAVFHIPQIRGVFEQVLLSPTLTQEVANQVLELYYAFVVIVWVFTAILVWVASRKLKKKLKW
jgi:hypothetical protein